MAHHTDLKSALKDALKTSGYMPREHNTLHGCERALGDVVIVRSLLEYIEASGRIAGIDAALGGVSRQEVADVGGVKAALFAKDPPAPTQHAARRFLDAAREDAMAYLRNRADVVTAFAREAEVTTSWADQSP